MHDTFARATHSLYSRRPSAVRDDRVSFIQGGDQTGGFSDMK